MGSSLVALVQDYRAPALVDVVPELDALLVCDLPVPVMDGDLLGFVRLLIGRDRDRVAEQLHILLGHAIEVDHVVDGHAP